jgi:catechol 2,3-dioxygenase-like lactoylglutathione lyase family enzyme
LRKQKFAETELREELDSMIRGVANVWMPVQDIERAVDFYQNILGFRLVNRDGPWAEVDANGVRVGLNGREPNGAGTVGGPVLTFQLEAISLEEGAQDLKSNGVEFPAGISEHDWGRVATFKDPDGNDLQLYEPPKS